MHKEELQRLIENLLARISTSMVEMKMNELLKKEGEELGGGINAMRLVRYLLGDPELPDPQLVWAYTAVKEKLEVCIEGTPKLYYFSGD